MTAALNAGLAGRAAAEDVGFLDVAALAARDGAAALFDPRGWYMAKIPYGPAALPVLARHTAAVLAARLGLSRRALVLDLDNTLWGGVIGDDGVDGIVLGQGRRGRGLRRLPGGAEGADRARHRAGGRLEERPRGGAPAVPRASRDGAEARRHRRLRRQLGAEVENIALIAAELGLGLDSLTFLDDNPYERAEVRRALPEVDVPVLPEEPTGFRTALEAYPYLEPAGFTDADRARAEQYRARAKAEAVRVTSGTPRRSTRRASTWWRGSARSTRSTWPASCSSSTRPTSST